jgi:hypothetical protein
MRMQWVDSNVIIKWEVTHEDWKRLHQPEKEEKEQSSYYPGEEHSDIFIGRPHFSCGGGGVTAETEWDKDGRKLNDPA